MAVNIDTVYQRVLAIANKEQRGYITPQEFNLLANQAQMEIFEQYFYDQEQFGRKPGNDTTYSDMTDLLEEKIDIFERFRQAVAVTGAGVGTLPAYYRMGELSYYTGSRFVEVEKISQNDLNHYLNSPLTEPTLERPFYIKTGENAIQIYPTTITNGSQVSCNCIVAPATVEWAYVTVLDEALYNANNSVNFELHASEEPNLVIKILELAGVVIKQQDVYSIANQEEAQDTQQEKI